MAITVDNKLVSVEGLKEFKTKYTDKYIGALTKDNAGTPVLATVKEYVDAQVATGGTGSKVTMEEVTTGLATDILKAYEFYQGLTGSESAAEKAAKKIGTVNTAKDLVVTSGQIVKDPTGQPAGTYLELTIANQTTPVYINVKDLCDVYTTGSVSTDMVVVAVDTATNKITATITDGTVTKAKLATALSDEITAATTAIGVETDAAKSQVATGIYKRIEDLETAAPSSAIKTVKVNGTALTATSNAVDVTVTADTASNCSVLVNGVSVATATVATTTEIDGIFA